ncbi:MAG: hypothetical protein P4L85_05525 [Paludisphaera borealis]|uniref:hypothetical protein n=1 Tax=Paludisphaera borealis TaxID=1387353 RepID=UPI0028439FFC|nr:hypothetical protein [Paludisphaera borealis]MDR3618791.1 hypothetical protein [Paludisphaera borealis]
MLRTSIVMWSLIGWPEIKLPLGLILLFGLLGLVALIVLYQRRRQLQITVEEQFKEFRERAVGLMDQLDALRQRHKTLPSTDPDFVEPMAGATLALYDQVSADLERMWERWLAVMEVWNQAEQRMRSASTFGVKPTEEARELLAGGGLEDLIKQSSLCEASLDRLNLAHEVARKSMREARRQLSLVEHALEGGELSSGVSDLYRREARLAQRELDDAEKLLTADPIGAEERIGDVRRSLADVQHQPSPRTYQPRDGFGFPSRSVLDDLAVAASRLQTLASNLRVTDVVAMLIKGWVLLWVLGLFLAILPALMPLILMFMGFVVIASGLRVFQRMAMPWYWYEPRRGKRRRPW